ncbi:MAG: hypothetical protein ACRD2I_12585, partial [Vicinamibacterales bacterium]
GIGRRTGLKIFVRNLSKILQDLSARPIGSFRTRYRESPTEINTPASRGAAHSSRTAARRRFTDAGRSSLNLKMMTLGLSSTPSADVAEIQIKGEHDA